MSEQDATTKTPAVTVPPPPANSAASTAESNAPETPDGPVPLLPAPAFEAVVTPVAPPHGTPPPSQEALDSWGAPADPAPAGADAWSLRAPTPAIVSAPQDTGDPDVWSVRAPTPTIVSAPQDTGDPDVWSVRAPTPAIVSAPQDAADPDVWSVRAPAPAIVSAPPDTGDPDVWSLRAPTPAIVSALQDTGDPDVWSMRTPGPTLAAPQDGADEHGADEADRETPTARGIDQEAHAPIPLDGFAHGIDPLDGLIVLSLSDGSIYGAWVRPEAGFAAEDVAPALREAYRGSLLAARKLAIFSAAREGRAEAAEPMVTVETPAQTALLKRVRSFVVACLFDGSIPLGMARLCAARLAASLEPELPLADLTRLTLPPPGARTTRASRPPPSLRFSMSRKAPHATPSEVEHVRRVIAYAESQLPDPHTVRLRLSLRSHTPRLSLDHPETMASDAILRIETAVLEMLGIDREQLGLALLGDPS